MRKNRVPFFSKSYCREMLREFSTTGIVVIFGILFYLYDIPFDAIIYGCELSFVWCAVCLFIDFYKYYKRHKLLHINRIIHTPGTPTCEISQRLTLYPCIPPK